MNLVINVLFGVFLTPSHATTTTRVATTTTRVRVARATCAGYSCPQGYYLRGNTFSPASEIHCLEASGCTSKDLGSCCISGTPPTTAKPDGKPDGGPCDPQTPAPTTKAPPKTCASYNCPSGWVAKPNNELIKCWVAGGCTVKDMPNCCTMVPTSAPTPAPTSAPTPSPPTVPNSCKVHVPLGGFAPWEVYKLMKASTPKIDTPTKMKMGGQTMNITNLNMRASQFKCQIPAHEMRAVLVTGTPSPVAVISIHDAVYPSLVTMQCTLTQISMYQSANGIPGMRFDYGNCPLGGTKEMTLMVGLKKVPDNWGRTPGLKNFFNDICPDEGHAKGDTQLRFDSIDPAGGAGVCFAQTADYTLMSSHNNCFEPSLVITLMDANNHFPVLPVKDSEWDWLMKKIPKAAVAPVTPVGMTPGTGPCDPMKPVPPNGPHVYGHIVQDRLCIAIPELGCHNYCGKDCKPVKPQSADDPMHAKTPTPDCIVCYDCETDQMWYALIGTILTFMCVNSFMKTMENGCCNGGSWGSGGSFREMYFSTTMMMPERPYSQLNQPMRARTEEGSFSGPCIRYGIISLIWTLIVFTTINVLNWLYVVRFLGQEMCLKLFSWQTNLQADWSGGPQGSHWHIGFGQHFGMYACHNTVCFWRLLGLMVAVWLSIWGLYSYWRWNMHVTAVKQEMKRVEAKVTMGAASGAGAMAAGGAANIACTVQ